MLSNLVATVGSWAATHAIHLVSGSIVAGIILLVTANDALIALVFLLQRGLVLALLCPHLPWPVAASTALASIAVALIYVITALRLHRQAREHASLVRPTSLLGHLPFRTLTAALALLLTSALVRRFSPAALPSLITWIVAWLVVQSVFSLLLAPSALSTGMGILAFADAGRILYALAGPDPILWGLWTSCDVLVALGAAHLRTNQVKASESSPQNIQETATLPAEVGEQPSSEGVEPAPPEEPGAPE